MIPLLGESLTEDDSSTLERYLSTINPIPAQTEIFREGIKKHKYGIYNKGRRLGATRGAAEAFIEYGLEGRATLWIDVVQGNIRRYFDAYFKPALKKAGLTLAASPESVGPNEYHFNKQDLILKFHTGRTDFRSADYPDRIEGFGYDVIFFNEAGLILNDDYIWKNAVLPMLLDNPNSSVIAAGTPKRTLGKGEFFEKLIERRDEGREGYGGRRIETYENPHLDVDTIEQLKRELADEGFDESIAQAQEIEGKVVDIASLGEFFKIKWFKEVDYEKPTRIVRGWDFAATPVSEANKDPDYTYSCGLNVHTAGLTIFDTTFLRAGPAEVDNHLTETLKADMALCKDITYVLPVDPASAGKVAFKHYEDLLKKVNPNIKVVDYPQTKNQGSKAERAKPAASLAQKEEITFNKTPRIDHFFLQLATFPNDEKHDDAVDAFAAAINKLSASTVRVSWFS